MNKDIGNIRFYHVAYMLSLIVIVGAPNLILSFEFSGLVHDDSEQMWRTSESSHKNWFGEVQFLNSFREDILFHIALYGSPQLARLAITFIYLCGSSLLLFILLRRFYVLEINAAILASSLPFLVLSMWQIPLGINISYVAGDIFFSLIALWLVLDFLRSRHFHPLDPIRLFVIFILIAETQPSGVITAPIICAAALTWGPTVFIRRLMASITTILAMLIVAYEESVFSRTSILPVEDVFSSAVSFWTNSLDVVEPAAPIPYWPVGSAILFLVGFGVMAYSAAISLAGREIGFLRIIIRGNKKVSGFLVLSAGLVWSPVPYVLTTPAEFIGNRYYFIWQFFFWVAFSIGLVSFFKGASLLCNRFFCIDIGRAILRYFLPTAVSIFLVYACVGKVNNKNVDFHRKNQFIKAFKHQLRNVISIDSRRRDQLLLLVSNANNSHIPHFSNRIANSGYINYLMAPIYFNYGNFSDPKVCSSHFESPSENIWGKYVIDGYSVDRSMMVYQYDSEERVLTKMDYMVDARQSGEQSLAFDLYDVSGTVPSIMGSFDSREDLGRYIDESNINIVLVAYGETVVFDSCGKDEVATWILNSFK